MSIASFLTGVTRRVLFLVMLVTASYSRASGKASIETRIGCLVESLDWTGKVAYLRHSYYCH